MSLEISPEFSTAGLAVALPLAAYLVLADPWLGRRLYADLKRRRDTDDRALTRYFGLMIAIWWPLAALAVAAVLLSPDVAAADVGFALPDSASAVAVTLAVAAAFGVSVVLGGRNMRKLSAEGRNIPGLAAIEAMLPRTPAERRLAVAVSVTDGICANVVYRGLLIALGTDVLGVGVFPAAAIAVAVAALVGLYQGAEQIPLFALWSAVVTAAYVATGSLLLPVLIHVVTVGRDLLAVPPALHPERV
ncbi:CPBP family glutamic-type intramembrane protease [Streptomyces sp. WMMC500]|uniref:CPBP family glutamic-type intramembrane protease n=1 Tax=Streptomyces sp. WMMC500 TaxID=3015154 RepID=UPI00248BB9B9|nr:CPBP family glutamic-type intramembrane protease [Streptomyces sp. WMMC500]WBB62288.1 CPBP family glutamic-type intramembrane protease [Streptomyces sp. WMMC500]